MRNPLERGYGEGDLHFITFSYLHRRPLLGSRESRDCFVRVLDAIRVRYGFRLIGYVVIPEHVHLLIGEPRIGDPSKVIQVLIHNSSRVLLKLGGVFDKSVVQHFWQRCFYDFNVWSGKKITEKLQYMQLNPVVRNLVTHPKDWP